MFDYLGFSLQAGHARAVSDPLLLDTIVAMTLNGVVFYGAAAALEKTRNDATRLAAQLLFNVAPFAMLQPIGYLIRTGEYAPRLDWLYAAAACAVILLSHQRQRKSFYYAGLLNLGAALFLIASHRHWFSRPAWAVALIAAGLAALVGGLLLYRRERRTPN